jgi:hypothetical protein
MNFWTDLPAPVMWAIALRSRSNRFALPVGSRAEIDTARQRTAMAGAYPHRLTIDAHACIEGKRAEPESRAWRIKKHA